MIHSVNVKSCTVMLPACYLFIVRRRTKYMTISYKTVTSRRERYTGFLVVWTTSWHGASGRSFSVSRCFTMPSAVLSTVHSPWSSASVQPSPSVGLYTAADTVHPVFSRLYLCYSVAAICHLSVTLCIVAKRCVLELKLLLMASRNSRIVGLGNN